MDIQEHLSAAIFVIGKRPQSVAMRTMWLMSAGTRTRASVGRHLTSSVHSQNKHTSLAGGLETLHAPGRPRLDYEEVALLPAISIPFSAPFESCCFGESATALLSTNMMRLAAS